MSSKPSWKRAEDFLSFADASPTPYHAVRSSAARLEKAGFKKIQERDSWASTCQPGGKYYLTRNGSSITAFAVGKKWKPGNPIAMIGAHTDSPCFRVKPVSNSEKDKYLQVGVETYGGGLWRTWFDRDLSLAGRVMARTNTGTIEQHLVKVEKPLLRIPNLAIHLVREEIPVNTEEHLHPIIGTAEAELNREGRTEVQDEGWTPLKTPRQRHHLRMVEIVAEEAGVDASAVVDFELVLYDTQKATIGGMNDEFIHSARLDNLMMSYCSVEGLIKSVESTSALEDESIIRLIALFDHEEIGSLSAQGANSTMLPSIVRRLSVLPASESDSDKSYDKINDTETAYEQSLAASFLISADMAHAVHPNYPSKYEGNHRPQMNQGTVIKVNANQRYMTNSPGVGLVQELARRANKSSSSTFSAEQGVPIQLFVVRNDSSCGSTIGPMLAAKLGTRCLDLGNPQLAMHSIREICGVHDVEHAINLFDSFFEHFGDLEKKIIVD